MLEVDDVSSPVVVDHSAAAAASTGSDYSVGRGPSPPLPALLASHVDTAVKSSAEEDADAVRGWNWPATTTNNNNNCIRYPPSKPEVDLESPQSGSRTAEVTTALAGFHAVLDRIDSVAERQQVVGDVIVHLQVLRCRLQLAQVNQPSPGT